MLIKTLSKKTLIKTKDDISSPLRNMEIKKSLRIIKINDNFMIYMIQSLIIIYYLIYSPTIFRVKVFSWTLLSIQTI